ncbi:heterokaryon incompatibility protein-domain-containing protein [Bisporella sp. PMI_857]|nr:heterokaryon incompatibility protein-domain-containing protein [Bisporella sp. PMI_857]
MNCKATDDENLGDFVKGVAILSVYVSTIVFFWIAPYLYRLVAGIIGSPIGVSALLVCLSIVHILRKTLSSQYKAEFRNALVMSLNYVTGRSYFNGIRAIVWTFDMVSAVYKYTSSSLNRWEVKVIDKRHHGTPAPFIYRPLREQREIRLLRLLRRKPFQRMRCELIHVQLDDAPPFEAISYTWRDEGPSISTSISGASLKVTPAVREILEYRQTIFGERFFWIDALCINQEDLDEKSDQIPLMKDIYKSASRVIVWLGPMQDVKDADGARGQLMQLVSEEHLYTSEELYRRVMTSTNPGWFALNEMLEHPWFSRVWVIQEVSAAATVHIMYGNVCLNWNTLAAGVQILSDPQICGPVQFLQRPEEGPAHMGLSKLIQRVNSLSNANIISQVRRKTQEFSGISMNYALRLSRNCKSSNSHDKVYAMLGLLSSGIPDYLRPDYRKPIVDVYVDAMRCIFTEGAEGGVPHFIQTAGIGNSRKTSGLPSWVPDLCAPPHFCWRGPQSYGWALQHPFRPEIVSTRHLKVNAMAIDKLCTIGALQWAHTNEVLDETPHGNLSWYQEAKELVKILYDAEMKAGEFPYEIFLRTLTGGKTVLDFSTRLGTTAKHLLDDVEYFLESINETNRLDSVPDVIDRGAVVSRVMFQMGHCCHGNRFAITEQGRLALVPVRTQKTDEFYFIDGLQFPFLLREKNNEVVFEGKTDVPGKSYQLVGSCYLDGMMDGVRNNPTWIAQIIE